MLKIAQNLNYPTTEQATIFFPSDETRRGNCILEKFDLKIGPLSPLSVYHDHDQDAPFL